MPEDRKGGRRGFSLLNTQKIARSRWLTSLEWNIPNVRSPRSGGWWRSPLPASLLAVALDYGVAGAQQRVVVTGTVQWATSTRIQVMTDAQVSVSIDVSRLPQGSYPLLRTGDRVNVVGVVSPDRSRLVAESVELGTPGGGVWNLFPEAP